MARDIIVLVVCLLMLGYSVVTGQTLMAVAWSLFALANMGWLALDVAERRKQP